MSGLPIEGNLNDNLCIKAYYLVKRDHPDLPPVRMHLHKAIAMGAGLGGGSSDGAFTLALLNSTFRLQIPIEKQLDYALQLGSDCPFFIINKPCIATGRGELLQRIQLDLSNYTFVLVLPGVHINTAWAFSQITPKVPAYSIREIIAQPIDSWRLTLVNDFEEAVCHHHPALKKVKDQLYEAGAVYASMTGSGSGFYGIFHSGNLDLTALQPFKYYIVKG
jgi:4-diphosphocytidyl-2-C-methyl-D-erythritol kinase